MRELDRDNLLRSWKEIAAYLGINTRTCHRWEERHGMPVHRVEGAETRSNVFAYKDELDAWFKRTFRGPDLSEPEAKVEAKAGKHRPWVRWTAASFLIFGLAGLFLLVLPHWFGPKGQPAGFRIEGSELVVLDRRGRELWRKNTGMEDLLSEAFYRRNFQVKHSNDYFFPALVMRDIDDDGHAEVLFVPKRVRDNTGEGVLLCYDRRGAELWDFTAGRELVCAGTVFSPDYRIAGIYVHDIDGDGRLETFVESWHAPQWPSLLTVLDASGEKIGEFWNAGRIKDFIFHDLTGDGREELVVVGVNNEYQGGFLAVFDPRHVSGSSPQTGKFLCDGLGPGSMLYYVTVPYPDVARAMGDRVSSLYSVEITRNERVRATQETGLIYEFGFDLAALQVQTSHFYENRHDEMVEAGRISGVLDGAYLADMLAGVRWWDGAEWESEPTTVRR